MRCMRKHEYEVAPPTPSADRHCASRRRCTPGQEYEVQPGEQGNQSSSSSVGGSWATTDRTCVILTMCDFPATEYEQVAATPTSDRQCARLTRCQGTTEMEIRPPTPTSDRGCRGLHSAAAAADRGRGRGRGHGCTHGRGLSLTIAAMAVVLTAAA